MGYIFKPCSNALRGVSSPAMPPQQTLAGDDFWLSLPLASAGYRMGLSPTDRWLTPATAGDRARKQRLLNARASDVLACCDGYAEQAAKACIDIGLALNQRSTDAGLVELALSVRDDLCIVDRTRTPTLIAACVCSPSYWCLADKIGQPIRAVHGDVPGMNEALGERIDSFFQRLPNDRVFERRNWFIHTSSERFQPDDDIVEDFQREPLFLRSERQTLRAFGSVVLFSIDVEIAPLAEIRRFPTQLSALLGALDALAGNELEHFGGEEKRQAIENLLRHWLQAPET